MVAPTLIHQTASGLGRREVCLEEAHNREKQERRGVEDQWRLELTCLRRRQYTQVTIPENLDSEEDPKRDRRGSNLHGK